MSKKAGNLRWSKFWWQDWLSDAALRFCTPAARGVWMDLLCLAHEGTPYGHVTVNGRVPTNRQLASMIGVSADELEPLLSELENAGVFSRRGALADDEKIVSVIGWLESKGHFKPCPDGVIFSRRMVRDMAAHIRGKETGSTGGNPQITPTPPPNTEESPTPFAERGLTPPVSPLEAKRLLEAEKEEPASQGAAAPDASPAQTSFLPPVPKPPPTPLDVLYAAGLPILVKLTGKSADHIRPHLGGLAKIAGPEIVLATLQDCENAPPKGSVYAWVRKCCEAEAKRRGVRLVVDNDPNDPWGVDAWCRSLPGLLPTETDEHRKAGKWLYSGAIVDGLARRIAEIIQVPPTWHGEWTLLGEWLAAGHDSSAILEVVTEITGRVDCVSSLRLFDERVRRLPCPNAKYLEALQRKSA